jgi:hypothetical protein
MTARFGTDTSADAFGGWSLADGNIAGWQYRAGEHDARFPQFSYGLDRNIWLMDSQRDPIENTVRWVQ